MAQFMATPFHFVQARADAPRSSEVWIYGDIGESWDGESVAAKNFAKEFSALDADDITVRINSYGGSVTDGLAIHNAIKRHPAKVTVEIDGAAFSIASLIAMAGDEVRMADNALMMIHAPWALALGNAADMRGTADTLDKYASAMASAYVAQSGKSAEDVMALLQDGKDHWFTAAEALAEGFIHTVSDALPIAARLDKQIIASRYPGFNAAIRATVPVARSPEPPTETVHTTIAAAAAKQESLMPETNTLQAATAAEILAADKSRRESVRAEFAPFAACAWSADLLKSCEDDTDCTAQAAAQKILAKLAADVQPVGAVHTETVEDEVDKRRDVIVATLLSKAGVADAKSAQVAAAGGMRGFSLIDFARASLDRAGVSYRGFSREEVAKAAFQSTSDFPILLENVMHKVLQNAYSTVSDSWTRFCAIGSVSDFRAHSRYRIGSLGNLAVVNESGEYTNVAVPDGEKASISAKKYGNIISLTTEMIVNDDMNAFMSVAAMQGVAAARTVEATVYAMLAENGGLGPVMGDGATLFHADHGNIGAGSAISVAGLDADRVLMGSQTDVSGNDFLDLRPSVLLLSLALGGTARVINQSQYDPDTVNKLQRPNMVAGLFSDIVDTARILGTRRYLFADPSAAPVLEVAFLDGRRAPEIRTEEGFRRDGIEYRVKHVFGVAAVDYRGAVTNAGA